MYITLVVVYLIGLVLIGLPMGILSLRIWRNARNQHDKGVETSYSTLAVLFFPLASAERKIGYETPLGLAMVFGPDTNDSYNRCDEYSTYRAIKYIIFTAVIWPLRVAVNTVFLSLRPLML